MLQALIETCVHHRKGDIVEDDPDPTPLPNRQVTVGDVFRRFGPCDPLWIEVVMAEALLALRHPTHFVDHPAPPHTMRDDARVVIVGDWGTGRRGPSRSPSRCPRYSRRVARAAASST